MTGLPARKLRHRVEIQRPVSGQNPETGSVEITWQKYADRWAGYVASSVRDFIAAGAYQSEVKGRFILRADPEITSQMRILHRGRTYAILGLMPDPDSGLEYITAPVSEGAVFDGR